MTVTEAELWEFLEMVKGITKKLHNDEPLTEQEKKAVEVVKQYMTLVGGQPSNATH